MENKEKDFIEEDDILEGENKDISESSNFDNVDYEEKRMQLKSLKILKHTWSLSEIYQKVKGAFLLEGFSGS